MVEDYFSLKDQTSPLFAPNVVYKFQCSVDGGSLYIEVTTQQLCARVEKHLNPRHQLAVQLHLLQCKSCCDVLHLSKLFMVLKQCRSKPGDGVDGDGSNVYY